jgi:alcohol dehydrogenase class IV
LAAVAGAVSKGKAPQDRRWVIGFHFNSGLYRLASLAERLGRYRGQDRRPIQDVSKEVQRLKHDIEGLARVRSVDVSRAVDASSRLVGMLEDALNQDAVDQDA